MNILQIDERTARALYPTAADNFKVMLEDKFGKENLYQKVTDRIKTWHDAAKVKGIDPVDSLPFIKPLNTFQEAANAFFMLDIIADVLNEGTVLDWANSNQKKWYAWFNNYQPGSGFSFYVTDCDWATTTSGGGARLCLHSQELAHYFGTQFLPLFNKFLNPVK